MYKNELAVQTSGALTAVVPQAISVRENIDRQIAMHEEALARLKETKEKLKAGGILDIDIYSLRAVLY